MVFKNVPFSVFNTRKYAISHTEDYIMRNTGSSEVYDFAHLRNNYSHFGGLTFERLSTVKHQHLDFYEIILIVSGEFTHIHKNGVTVLPSHTLLLLKPGSTHQLFTEPGGNTHFVLCIEKRHFEKRAAAMFPDFHLDSFDEFLYRSINKNKAFYMEQLATALVKDYKSNIALADEMIYLCLADFASLNITRNCEYYIDDIIRNLDHFQYMNASAKEIYSQYPYSESILLREFKKRTGMTIAEYRTQQKMKYACQLLSETNTAVLGIAYSLNYSSLSCFIRTFRKFTGMNPTEYRKKHQRAHKQS